MLEENKVVLLIMQMEDKRREERKVVGAAGRPFKNDGAWEGLWLVV